MLFPCEGFRMTPEHERERAAWRAVVERGMSLAGSVAEGDPAQGIDPFLNYWDVMDGSCSVALWFGEAYLYGRGV